MTRERPLLLIAAGLVLASTLLTGCGDSSPPAAGTDMSPTPSPRPTAPTAVASGAIPSDPQWSITRAENPACADHCSPDPALPAPETRADFTALITGVGAWQTRIAVATTPKDRRINCTTSDFGEPQETHVWSIGSRPRIKTAGDVRPGELWAQITARADGQSSAILAFSDGAIFTVEDTEGLVDWDRAGGTVTFSFRSAAYPLTDHTRRTDVGEVTVTGHISCPGTSALS